ncbi:hypothetical protein GCM10022271_06490 [Corallibacter vietnamensis]|uniref:DUF4349 domain-containing protein n=1 Tax=Corallibacter vietnamensis TaxID=904130 RepID=A0ABP7GY67_9FLAO
MSNNLPEQNNRNQSDEIDLVLIFNLIGNAFSRLFGFIGGIFKAIFSTMVYALKAIILNLKIIVITVVIAGVLGYGVQKTLPSVYTTFMLVKPYFDSKYQLITNIGYFNALISTQDYETLSSVFEISEDEARKISRFEIYPGPETENERIIQYDEFLKQIDSVRAQEISFDEYIENRSIYSGSVLYEIHVFSKKKNIFKSLEKGLNSSFENTYSKKKMLKRDSLINIQRNTLREQIGVIDSLQKVYISVLQEESKTTKAKLNMGESGFPMVNEKSQTREYDLLKEKIKLQNELKELDEQQTEENTFFDVVSGFQEVGNEYLSWKSYLMFIFPVLAFLLLCLIYLTGKIIKFVKNYDE